MSEPASPRAWQATHPPAPQAPGGDAGRATTAPAPGRGGKRRVASGLVVAVVFLGLVLGGCWETESSPSAQARWDQASWDEAIWPDAKGE